MKRIRLMLDNDVFEEMESITTLKNLDRNRYINEALGYYYKLEKRKILADKIAVEEELLKEDSMRVLRDFDSLARKD